MPGRPLQRGLQTSQLEQSFRQLPISLVVNLINGLILAVVLWDVASPPVVLIWLSLLVAVTDARYVTLSEFNRSTREPPFDHEFWARSFAAGALAAGIVWGLAGVLLFHPTSLHHQLFLAFVLGGMVAGAVPLLSPVAHAYRAFAIPVVIPISIKMLAVGDFLHLVMGLMIAVFGVAMLASSARVSRLSNDLESLRRQLLASIETGRELASLIRLDPLTEIPNRRLFEEVLDKEWGIAERNDEPLAVMIADIDYFKEYNDRYGHPAGDDCLVKVAQAMQRALSRPGDVVSRIGGEEFAFLLPRTNAAGAMSVAEHIRDQIQALYILHETSPAAKQITLSFGVASSAEGAVGSSAELIRAADDALFEAKRRGRNQVAQYQYAEKIKGVGDN